MIATARDLNFLVVDDDDFLRLTVKNLLQSFEAGRILEASSGAEALDILRSEPADGINIVLCDLNMPGMDGMELLRHMGETRTTASIVVVSAYDDNLISSVLKMAEAYGLKTLGSVRKPVSRAHLETLIARHVAVQNNKPAAARAYAPPPRYSLEDIIEGLRDKQFEPFFQPQISMKTGTVVGAEALARWIHPSGGIISPYVFIEPLEKSGHISDLTFQIIEKSATACRQLHAAGHKINVSVNLSSDLLSDPTLADRITQVVQEAGATPSHVVIEITETGLITDVAHSLENLARLKMRGFGLSVDDYGTGFSNIQRMTRIAFDEIKIDQSFVSGFSGNDGARAIVKSSIEMAIASG